MLLLFFYDPGLLCNVNFLKIQVTKYYQIRLNLMLVARDILSYCRECWWTYISKTF